MQNVCSQSIGDYFIDDVVFYSYRFNSNTINEST